MTTSEPESAGLLRESSLRLGGLGIATLVLLPFSRKLHKRIRRSSLLLAILCLLLVVSGCEGTATPHDGSKLGDTPPGNYILTITASTATTSVQQNLSLIVQ